jgi:hypothetical protein
MHDTEQRTVPHECAVVIGQAELADLFMKKLIRDRVVLMISASVSRLILAIISSGAPSCRKLASSNSYAASLRA